MVTGVRDGNLTSIKGRDDLTKNKCLVIVETVGLWFMSRQFGMSRQRRNTGLAQPPQHRHRRLQPLQHEAVHAVVEIVTMPAVAVDDDDPMVSS